jgi:hypothetical protein
MTYAVMIAKLIRVIIPGSLAFSSPHRTLNEHHTAIEKNDGTKYKRHILQSQEMLGGVKFSQC